MQTTLVATGRILDHRNWADCVPYDPWIAVSKTKGAKLLEDGWQYFGALPLYEVLEAGGIVRRLNVTDRLPA